MCHTKKCILGHLNDAQKCATVIKSFVHFFWVFVAGVFPRILGLFWLIYNLYKKTFIQLVRQGGIIFQYSNVTGTILPLYIYYFLIFFRKKMNK